MSSSSISSLAAIGEFGLISRITGRVVTNESVIAGIGDDAAVTALSPGMQLLTSTDMLLEDVHFRRSWHDPYRLGRKSLAVSISDIAAMGGIPRWSLLSIAIPADLPLVFIDDFMCGYLSMAAENNVILIGGDTCSSRAGLVLSVTIMGEQLPEQVVCRSGAQPGDDIWVTGTLGDAALGLKLSEDGEPVSEELIARLLDPAPRVSAARALTEAGVVTAMIDVSDGILADFGHIAEHSGVGGCIQIGALPLSRYFCSYSADFSDIPYHLALSGGEDYELCFTADRSNRENISDCMKKCGIAMTRIGIVSSSVGVSAVYPDGSIYKAQRDGFTHFK
ncbi:MAG: thiamine-phosphate kinase [Desulfuromonadaceae bacterium]|nr:thiamine-phosphate kinase [Desulfuromonadaceae bacterium]